MGTEAWRGLATTQQQPNGRISPRTNGVRLDYLVATYLELISLQAGEVNLEGEIVAVLASLKGWGGAPLPCAKPNPSCQAWKEAGRDSLGLLNHPKSQEVQARRDTPVSTSSQRATTVLIPGTRKWLSLGASQTLNCPSRAFAHMAGLAPAELPWLPTASTAHVQKTHQPGTTGPHMAQLLS